MSLFASSRQLQAAASHDSIDDLLAAPQPRVQLTSGYSEGYQDELDRLAADFHDFFLDMSEQPNGLNSFHPQHRSLADVFCPGSPSLSYQSAALFIKHWASTSGRPLHVNTALSKVFVLAKHTRHTTDNPFDPTTFSQLAAYCTGDLQVQLGLATGPPPSSFIQNDVLHQIFRSLFAPDLNMQCFRSRWQMAYWTSMTVATEARVGTCLKGKQKYKKQKRLVWGDITLVVTKSKLTGGVNQLSHFFESPNAKRGKIWTAELDWFPVLWLDATFYLLIIAHIAGALSDGWTYDQLLDPRQFDSRPGDCFELSFNPAKSTEAVFLGTGNENEWTTGAVGAHLDQITAHAGLQGRVTPHSLRRSGAVAMKLKNATHEQIQQQLNHAVGTATFERYSGFIVTADASASVYETAGRVEDTHQHHPERVKVLPRLPDVLPALSISARQNLLSGQKMTNALLASSHALDEELRSNDVESYTALPPKAKSRLGVIYKRAQRLYRRLYRRKWTEVNSHVGPTNISNDDNDDDDDDDDADDEQGSGDAAVESSVNGVAETEPPLDRIDDFPEAEEAGGDAIQAAHFLERTDLENPSTTYRLMREARQRSDPTPAESSHHALESNTVRSEAVRTINLPADWAIDPELESLAVETVNPFVPPATENDSHRPGDPTGVAHQDPAMTNDFTTLFKVVEALFANREGNRGEAYALCMALPLDDTLLFGYRPGHAPVNNCCNFCDQPIPSVVSFPKNRPNDNVTMKRHIATHVNNCAALLAMYMAEDELLRKYPSSTPLTPITGKTAFESSQKSRKAIKPAEGDPFSVYDLTGNVRARINKAQRDDRNPPTCKLNGCGQPPLFTWDFARFHLADGHGIFLPFPPQEGNPRNAQDVHERGFRATYYLHDSEYHCDPVETNRFALELITTRIIQVSDNVDAYGLRKDIKVNSGVLSEDDNGSLPDHKYRLRTGRSSSVIRDGLCLICVHNENLSPSTRGRPFNDEPTALNEHHQRGCIASAVKDLKTAETAYREGETLNRRTYLWSQDRIICPDPVCRRRDRKFDNKLDWLKHLVAVHFIHIKGPNIDRTQRIVNLDELTFADEAELETWARVKIEKEDDQAAGGDGDVDDGKDRGATRGSSRRASKRRSPVKDEDEDNVEDDEAGTSTQSRTRDKKARKS